MSNNSAILSGFILCLSHVFTPQAVAQQSQFGVDKGAKQWSFDVRWRDQDSKRYRAQFSLPAARIQNDLSVPLRFNKRAANVEIVRAINEYGQTLKKVKVKASKVRATSKVKVKVNKA